MKGSQAELSPKWVIVWPRKVLSTFPPCVKIPGRRGNRAVVSNAFTAKPSYDVFLSYNSADHGVVEDVARKLRDEGLEPFLDRWYLAPGARWRSKLEDTLSSCKAVAIFVGPSEMGSWQQREVDVALDLQSRSPNLPVIPVLLPGCEPPLGFLRQLTWVDLRTQTRDLGILILAKAARGEAPGPDLQKHLDAVRVSICPYRGLLYFREEDAPFFFGREAGIDKLTDAVLRQPLVTVVGASGSGKSSVVRAGLVPRLRSDRRTAWETVILVPTDQPLKALARAFVPLLEPTMREVDRLAEATKLAEHFRSETVSLCDIVERIIEKQSGTNRLLIVVDQFEELYTLTSDEEVRRRFLDELLAASSRAGCKANIALTLRGDFVGRALAYRPLSDRLQDAQINLGPMTREELEWAIRKPAEKIQLEFEPGLIRRILNDVGDEPGNLPLLEFVLKELWDKRRGSVLLNETYDAIGGLQGAVAAKADELLKGLSLAKQKILQRVFLRIVRPSESGLDTRRRAAFTELPPEGADLVVKLANERLLVTNQSASGLEQTVEVAHEALISNWSTLRAWVNEDREFLLWRMRLGALLTEWDRAQESHEALLRGPLIIEAQKWFDQRSQDLSDQERKFISASRALRERLARGEKERQEREIEAARKLAEAQQERAEEAEKRAKEQKDSANRLRRRALAAAGAAAVALILLAVSLVLWNAARQALRQSYLTQATALRGSENPGRQFKSLRLVVEAAKISTIGPATELRNEAIADVAVIDIDPLVSPKPWKGYPPIGLAFDSKLERYAHSDDLGNISVRRVTDDHELVLLAGPEKNPAWVIRFSPNGHFLAAKYHQSGAADPNPLYMWDLGRGEVALKPKGGVCNEAFDFSPDSRFLVVGQCDGSIHLFDLALGQDRTLTRGGAPLSSLAFRPPNSQQVAFSSDNALQVLDVNSGKVIKTFSPPEPVGVSSITWSSE
jgi:TIR domain/AAA ATPase domain